MKTIKERAQSLLGPWREASDWNEAVSVFLRDLIDAPEPKPVAYQVRNGWVNIAIYQRQIDAENYAKDQQKRHDLSGSLAHFCVVPLYTSPPAPSVPEPAAKVLHVDGLLSNNLIDCDLPVGTLLYTAPAAPVPARLVWDAERHQWLRTYNTAKHPAVAEEKKP